MDALEEMIDESNLSIHLPADRRGLDLFSGGSLRGGKPGLWFGLASRDVDREVVGVLASPPHESACSGLEGSSTPIRRENELTLYRDTSGAASRWLAFFTTEGNTVLEITVVWAPHHEPSLDDQTSIVSAWIKSFER